MKRSHDGWQINGTVVSDQVLEKEKKRIGHLGDVINVFERNVTLK